MLCRMREVSGRERARIYLLCYTTCVQARCQDTTTDSTSLVAVCGSSLRTWHLVTHLCLQILQIIPISVVKHEVVQHHTGPHDIYSYTLGQ
jgi:hypothetical protein